MRLFLIACVALSAAFPASATADPAGQASFGVGAFVAESCTIGEVSLNVGPQDDSFSGSVMESCNSNRPYRILVMHRALGERERVAVQYGDVTTRLERSGVSPIVTRTGPRHRRVPVRIDAELDQNLRLGFVLAAL